MTSLSAVGMKKAPGPEGRELKSWVYGVMLLLVADVVQRVADSATQEGECPDGNDSDQGEQ